MSRGAHVVIVGGGIGGCALALSLNAAGFNNLDVYETASETREVGVGINLLPHAVRELDELGLLAELESVAVATEELLYLSTHGQRIWREPRGRLAGYHWPQLSIHRGELLTILYRSVVERIGSERIHHGHHLAWVEPDDERPTAVFVEPGTDGVIAEVGGDIVVGCDGVHSAVRRTLVPGEGPPNWNGITMWRGVTRADALLSGRSMLMAGHMGRRVVAYSISAELERQGRSLVNWVAEYRRDDERPMPPQDWDHTVDVDEVLGVFENFVFDFLDVPQLIREAEVVFQYPMVDRDPLDAWTRGRVSLLGDAAHPMYPVGSNGASQAIIDARVLARHLALNRSHDVGLAAYEAERLPATAEIVLANRRAGPERCMEIVEERAPDGFTRIEDVIGREELEAIADEYKSTAGFSVDALNDRPSLSVK